MAIFFERFDFVVLKPVKVSENAWQNSEAENILDADKKSDIKWVSDETKTARGLHFNHDGFGCEKKQTGAPGNLWSFGNLVVELSESRLDRCSFLQTDIISRIPFPLPNKQKRKRC